MNPPLCVVCLTCINDPAQGEFLYWRSFGEGQVVAVWLCRDPDCYDEFNGGDMDETDDLVVVMPDEEDESAPAKPHTDFHGLQVSNFADLVRYRVKIQAAKAQIEKAEADNKVELLKLMKAAGAQRVSVDGILRATLSKGKKGSKSIDPLLLMKNGVTTTVIEASTVQGPDGKPYVLVTDTSKPRAKRGDGKVAA